MFGTIKDKTRYIGKFRRPLGITLEWPRDGDAARAIVRVQRFDRRRDENNKAVSTPLGPGWALPPSEVAALIAELQRCLDLMKIEKL